MSEHSFKVTRAIVLAWSAVTTNAAAILLSGLVLVAAPTAAQLYMSPPNTQTITVRLPPANRPQLPAGHAIGVSSAGALPPIRMYLDATDLLLPVLIVPPAVLFDGFVIASVLDHSARRQRSVRQRLAFALRQLWALLVIDVFALVATMVASVLLLAPAAFVVAGLMAAGPARLMEQLSPFAAISRSLKLGWGRFWKMSAVAVVFIIAPIALEAVTPRLVPHATLGTRLWIAAWPALLAIAVRGGGAALSAALYVELTRREFGAPITQVEKVFV